MPEVILVVLQRSEMALPLLRAAARLAALAGGAHVHVLGAAPSIQDGLLSALGWLASANRPEKVLSHSHTMTEAGAVAIEESGSRSDIVVIAQPTHADTRTVRDGFRAALFGTDRPLLVVPPDAAAPEFGHRVAVAWREDAHTAKVVVPALRYVVGADAVFVIAGMRVGRTVPDIPEVLKDRNVPAELHLVPIGTDGFGKTLFAKLQELEVDMLIMGAHAHNKIYDIIYGSVTNYAINYSKIPIFMRY